jgi:5'(3')-deoxyribonucleotidase
MTKTALIKSGDKRLLINEKPPEVDCRVVAEDNYNDILQTFKEIRTWDIKRYVNGSDGLMPIEIRKKIAEFLDEHGI